MKFTYDFQLACKRRVIHLHEHIYNHTQNYTYNYIDLFMQRYIYTIREHHNELPSVLEPAYPFARPARIGEPGWSP